MADTVTTTLLLLQSENDIPVEEIRRLEGRGYHVIVRHNGSDAVSDVAADADGKIGLALVDLELGAWEEGAGELGADTAERILEIRDLPVLFLTGEANEAAVRRAAAVPHYGFVPASSSSFLLEAAVRRALEMFHAHSEAERRAEERADHLSRVLEAIRKVNQHVARAPTRYELLAETCNTLLDTRGFYYAWVLLDDEQAGASRFIVSGRGSPPEKLKAAVESGYRPTCVAGPDHRDQIHVTEDPAARCGACPFKEPARTFSLAGLTGRLEYGGRVYGTLTASIPRRLAHDAEEIDLFRELIQDVSFGLSILEDRERLRESEEHFRLLAENMPGVAYLCRNDPSWSMLYLNDHARDLTGYEPRHFYTGMVTLAGLIHPDDRERVYDEVQAALGAQRPFHLIYRLTPKTGAVRWIEEFGDAVRVDGEVAYLEGLLTDITERRKREEQIARLLEEKELLVREVYHRVKNNMLTISSLLSLQTQYVADDCAEVIAEARDRVTGMVELYEVLHTADDTTGVALADYLARSADELVAAHARPDLLTVERVFEDVEVDAQTAFRLGLVFTELLTNALKHAFPDDRRGTLAVELRRPTQDEVLLVVADDGVGIPVSDAGEGVESRPEPTGDAARETGFGLGLVDTMVGQLRGSARYESEHGTRVEIRVPAAPPARKEDAR